MAPPRRTIKGIPAWLGSDQDDSLAVSLDASSSSSCKITSGSLTLGDVLLVKGKDSYPMDGLPAKFRNRLMV